MAATGFDVGDEITVVGLIAKPQHNGKRGVVLGFQGARVQVLLQDHGSSKLALKPANLETRFAANLETRFADFFCGEESSDEDGVIGFHITESGEREKMHYSCMAERTWVELYELVEHELWDEAEGRIDGKALPHASLLN